jgi:hypothetical protein
VVEVDEGGVQMIRQVGATGAGTHGVVGAEHDVVREQLRAPVEELGERLLPFIRIEGVLLLHWHPGQLLPLLCQCLAPLGVLVLGFE